MISLQAGVTFFCWCKKFGGGENSTGSDSDLLLAISRVQRSLPLPVPHRYRVRVNLNATSRSPEKTFGLCRCE